ncbi:hypothetical protein AGMMS49959_07260 [Planctomycetales bacterium]|nr:hypothetical protein AGMMS49959_07260 [Planctomycetales bacterium]
MRNPYCARTKISTPKFRQILRLFAVDLEATKVAVLSGVTRKTINELFGKVRARIDQLAEAESPFDCGEIEVDESYFGARRVRGKRGRGGAGKTRVFGLKKRGDKVYTQVVKNCSAAQLVPIIKRLAPLDSVIYTHSELFFGERLRWC